MKQDDLPLVSVVVPVFGDLAPLQACLRGLARQTYPESRYEVVVVDNGSSEGLDRVVGKYSRARIVHEARPGSYAARNAGVRSCVGEVVAFTDADCIPFSDWLEHGVRALRTFPSCDVAAGAVEIYPLDSRRPTAIELYDMVSYLQQRVYTEEWSFGATANLFAWKRIFDAVGYFDPSLYSSGDVEWGNRVVAAGCSLAYAAEAKVEHPAQRTWRGLIEREARLEGGHQVLSRRRDPSATSAAKVALARLVPPVRRMISLALDKRLQGSGARAKVAGAAFVVRYAQAYELLRLACGGAPRR